jgi:hypothetical protein
VLVATVKFEHVSALAFGDSDLDVEIHSLVRRFCYASSRARLWPRDDRRQSGARFGSIAPGLASLELSSDGFAARRGIEASE